MEEMRTEEAKLVYDVLLQKKVAERLPNYTSKIMEILIKDKNKDLIKTIHNYLDENFGMKICLEEPQNEEHINLHLYDRDDGYQLVQTIRITDNIDDEQDLESQIVQEETFELLEKYVVDYDTAKSDSEFSMQDSI